MEQKIVVANFVRNFTFRSLDPRDKLVVVGEMVLRPRNGLRVEIKSRFDHKTNNNKVISPSPDNMGRSC